MNNCMFVWNQLVLLSSVRTQEMHVGMGMRWGKTYLVVFPFWENKDNPPSSCYLISEWRNAVPIGGIWVRVKQTRVACWYGTPDLGYRCGPFLCPITFLWTLFYHRYGSFLIRLFTYGCSVQPMFIRPFICSLTYLVIPFFVCSAHHLLCFMPSLLMLVSSLFYIFIMLIPMLLSFLTVMFLSLFMPLLC